VKPISFPKISVVSACFNHGKYINEMIESVLNQTFQDFEIIIVDDGSTDNSREILNEIKNDRIKVIFSEHSGPAAARNQAIKFARANFILNLDADDKILQDYLEKAYEIFSINPKAGIVYTNCSYFGAQSGIMERGQYNLKGMLAKNKIVSAALFLKEDWMKVGGYSEDFKYGLEDWDLWLNIIETGREIVKIPDSCIFYRKYKDPSESRSGRRISDRNKTIHSMSLIFSRHRELYSLYPAIYRRFSKFENANGNEMIIIKCIKDCIFKVKQQFHFLIN